VRRVAGLKMLCIGQGGASRFRAKIERMASHIHAAAAEGDALGLQAHALLQTRVPRETNVSPGAQHAMPGDAALSMVQRPSDLPGSAGVARGLRHVAVRRHAPFRDLAYGAAQSFQHLSYQSTPRFQLAGHGLHRWSIETVRRTWPACASAMKPLASSVAIGPPVGSCGNRSKVAAKSPAACSTRRQPPARRRMPRAGRIGTSPAWVARYGGEKFAIMLAATGAADAMQFANGVCLSLAALGLRNPHSLVVKVILPQTQARMTTPIPPAGH